MSKVPRFESSREHIFMKNSTETIDAMSELLTTILIVKGLDSRALSVKGHVTSLVRVFGHLTSLYGVYTV